MGRKDYLIEKYNMFLLPVENTYISESDRSLFRNENDNPLFSTMFGLYCNEPFSHSCFHRLKYEEIWTFLEGDSINLYLLYEDGKTNKVVLGSDMEKGERRQEYGFYKCTVIPAFKEDIFEAGIKEELISRYPGMSDIITKLNDNGYERFI